MSASSSSKRDDPKKARDDAPLVVGAKMPVDAYGEDGTLLLARGETILSPAQLQRLRRYDVRFHKDGNRSGRRKGEAGFPGDTMLPFHPTRDLEEEFAGALTEPAIQPAPPEPTSTYAQELPLAEAARVEVKNRLDGVFRSVGANETVDLSAVRAAALNVLESVVRNERALLSLLELRSADQYTFTHSLNCCVLAIILARRTGLAHRALPIGVSALLHDIGKLRLPAAILQKPDTLTPEEWELVYRHPAIGFEIAQRSSGGATDLCNPESILQHHERMNGSGYPRSLTGRNIGFEGRLIAVADVYDAMTSARSYREAIPGPRVMHWLREKADLLFDRELVDALVAAVGVFPVGSLVMLSSNELAVIAKVHRVAPLRPVVLVVSDGAGAPLLRPKLLDLSAPTGPSGPPAIVGLEDPRACKIDPRACLASVDDAALNRLGVTDAPAPARDHIDVVA